jgi:molecular chaperone HscB
MNLNANDFEILGLPLRFAQEEAEIEARWRTLQREVHPDRFVAQGSAAHTLALEYSARVTQARNRLKDPLRRAAYLCQLQGHPVGGDEGQTATQALPTAFLVEQMDLHEALEEAQNEAQIQALADQIGQKYHQQLAQCAKWLDETGDYAQAAQGVRLLFFYQRLLTQVQKRLANFPPPALPTTEPTLP